ncbi:hypothetical protein [Ferrimonas marina]|uniref:Flagellar export protein FliJ n=1 Tax=Ferrimonas marina TaxID=299255 RepID=A0A1M5TD38_9GAMM|nr:hypothetical protein [Ferrimonas marina]SHH48697.1 flagellar export protein FliJ [Ferrimonas marina]
MGLSKLLRRQKALSQFKQETKSVLDKALKAKLHADELLSAATQELEQAQCRLDSHLQTPLSTTTYGGFASLHNTQGARLIDDVERSRQKQEEHNEVAEARQAEWARAYSRDKGIERLLGKIKTEIRSAMEQAEQKEADLISAHKSMREE